MNVKTALRKYVMVIATVAVIIFFTIATKGALLYPQNVSNVIAQNAYVFVLAAGMLLCILTGGNIDLSVGSVVCLVGAVGGTLMCNKGLPIALSILIMIAVGLLIGVWQGYLVAYLRVPPFIANSSTVIPPP